jgi:acetyl esterase/lipase
MYIKTVDLYKEHNKKRSDNAKGILQCYLPFSTSEIGGTRKYPAILIIPGGGYEFVSQREAEPVALRYIAKGFAAFVLEYSVAPYRYPTAFMEAAIAMLYLRSNAQSLSIGANRIAAMGFSAGGHLCGCLATLFDAPEIRDELGGRTGYVRPDAVILSYPVVTSGRNSHAGSFDNLCGEDEDLKRRLSLENCVSKNSPPAFIWHSFSDQSVPVQNSLLLASAYAEKGVPFSLHIFEKGNHGLSTADWGAYRADDLPDISSGLTGWVDMSADWLADRRIIIEDK